jgi:hypothetical protein
MGKGIELSGGRMDLNEIDDLAGRVGVHRLKMSAVTGDPMGMFCDMWVDGRPMLTVLAIEGGGQREMVNKIASELGVEAVAVTHDSYMRLGAKPDTVHEPLAPAFKAGDPGVSEALTIATASNDRAPINSSRPYTRLPSGRIKFDAEQMTTMGMTSGRIPNEIVEMLNGHLNRDFAEMLIRFSHRLPNTVIHIYSSPVWDFAPFTNSFAEHWTKTGGGWISASAANSAAISLLDVTMSDEQRIEALSEMIELLTQG